MVQLGPDNQGNVWMGGYEYAINSISGFSHLHAWTMGGLMIMPTTADLALSNPSSDSPYKGANAGYHSRILKETEKASPGYYSVYLYDHEVTAELSATTRCGIHRYTFPERKESRILIDLLFPTEWDYGFSVKDACITRVSDTELEGYADCQSGSWSRWNDYKLHFIIRFSKPFSRLNGWNEGKEVDDIQAISGKNDIGVYALYTTKEGESITVSTGLSLVSIEQARLNMEAELAPLEYDFDRVAAQTRTKWNKLLGKIEIEGQNEVDKTKFYTNLYRAYAGKQTWNDVNGQYRDACENVQQLDHGNMYGGDAFWNSFWNLNGLWSIISPRIVDDWVTTQLEMFKHTGWTSKGPAGLEYSGIMEGSPENQLPPLPVPRPGTPMRWYIASLLRCLGVPARLSGFNYLVETLLLLVNRPFETRLVTGEVYPVVAKQCNTTPIGVDQAIRTAVNQTWQEQNIPVYCALMGRSPAPHEPRPTSCEFLANVLMYVRIQMAECHY